MTDPVFVWGMFNLSLWGSFTGTVQLERTLDGTNFVVVATDGIGTPAIYTAPIGLLGEEIELGAQYRVNCTAFSSGPINYRLSQSNCRLRF